MIAAVISLELIKLGKIRHHVRKLNSVVENLVFDHNASNGAVDLEEKIVGHVVGRSVVGAYQPHVVGRTLPALVWTVVGNGDDVSAVVVLLLDPDVTFMTNRL